MARVLAAKPHSADAERLISDNNTLKTCLRNSLNIETKNLCLFIHVNVYIRYLRNGTHDLTLLLG